MQSTSDLFGYAACLRESNHLSVRRKFALALARYGMKKIGSFGKKVIVGITVTSQDPTPEMNETLKQSSILSVTLLISISRVQ